VDDEYLESKLPLKIKIFLWQICNDKVQSADQLKKRNWARPVECKLCGQMEITEHIFIQCVVASSCWSVIRDVLEWPNKPVVMEDLWVKLVEGSSKKNRNFIFSVGLFGVELMVD
jgi:hypothetical protein